MPQLTPVSPPRADRDPSPGGRTRTTLAGVRIELVSNVWMVIEAAIALGVRAEFWFGAAAMAGSGLLVALLMYETLPTHRCVHPTGERDPRFT